MDTLQQTRGDDIRCKELTPVEQQICVDDSFNRTLKEEIKDEYFEGCMKAFDPESLDRLGDPIYPKGKSMGMVEVTEGGTRDATATRTRAGLDGGTTGARPFTSTRIRFNSRSNRRGRIMIINKSLTCDYCLREHSEIFNTKKLGLSRTFGSQICSRCLLFRLRERRDAYMAQGNTH